MWAACTLFMCHEFLLFARFLLPIALVPIGGRNLQTVRQRQRKVTNAAPLTFTEKHFLQANELLSLGYPVITLTGHCLYLDLDLR